MLDSETKRRIDSARDILVGKVPDPKSQVEQITIALIYKFMDDMDAEAEELGGKRKFFTGEFARYGWAKLMSPGIGGHELIGLYGEGIAKMLENPGIPPLFRDIFKNAYLPYRDPETLKSFLKIIKEFSYDHSEDLGDAFEYLLSVLGSQGDAGQFRTPRHIIDFIVDIIEPKKDEVILDPACGTAGFLISAYKYILRTNKDAKSANTLTPDEKGRLAQHFKGYDISPDMVRLSLTNLYLHGFSEPHVYEYDTLTSEERWNEFADVILANPPFMSPKGGIKPHKRFSIQAKRSEVLFVDYIAEHLKPTGRAGIIVPEGIIFQSQTAYKDLRKMLVENSLVAVISLPAGVFNPYSGVKTSILILDKSLAKKSNSIAFFKIDNDGFGLGAQRRANTGGQLTQAKAELAEYLHALRNNRSTDNFQTTLGQIVSKEKIAMNGDYNLNAERYREGSIRNTNYPMVPIGEICNLYNGRTFKAEEWEGIENNGMPIIRIQNLNNPNSKFNYFSGEVNERNIINNGELLFSWSGSRGTSFGAHIWKGGKAALNQHIFKVTFDETRIIKMYLFHALNKAITEIEENLHGGVGLVHITKGNLEKITIPLPPLEIQREIVAEIEGYQKVIDGARAVADNYRPHIPISLDWKSFAFSEAPIEIIDGDRGTNYPKKEDFTNTGYCLFLSTKNVRPNGFNFFEKEFISKEKDQTLRKGKLQRGDIVLTTRGTVGNTGLYDDSVEFNNIRINSGMLILRPDKEKLSALYLFHFLQSENFKFQCEAIVSGSAQPQLPIRNLNEIKIPLPSLSIQQQIVAEIEAEQLLVNGNLELITRLEKKIQTTLARVWGEELPTIED